MGKYYFHLYNGKNYFRILQKHDTTWPVCDIIKIPFNPSVPWELCCQLPAFPIAEYVCVCVLSAWLLPFVAPNPNRRLLRAVPWPFCIGTLTLKMKNAEKMRHCTAGRKRAVPAWTWKLVLGNQWIVFRFQNWQWCVGVGRTNGLDHKNCLWPFFEKLIFLLKFIF